MKQLVKLLILAIVLIGSNSLAQTDLSTPGGQSILVTFTSEPPGAEIYVSNTFVGRTPLTVRLNANTRTEYRILIQSSDYQESVGFVEATSDITIHEPLAKIVPPDDFYANIPIGELVQPQLMLLRDETPLTKYFKLGWNAIYDVYVRQVLIEKSSEVPPITMGGVLAVLVDNKLYVTLDFNPAIWQSWFGSDAKIQLANEHRLPVVNDVYTASLFAHKACKNAMYFAYENKDYVAVEALEKLETYVRLAIGDKSVLIPMPCEANWTMEGSVMFNDTSVNIINRFVGYTFGDDLIATDEILMEFFGF